MTDKCPVCGKELKIVPFPVKTYVGCSLHTVKCKCGYSFLQYFEMDAVIKFNSLV